MIDKRTGKKIVSPADKLKPRCSNRHLRIVDCRPAYHNDVPQSVVEDLEKQACRLALRFRLPGTSADKLATLIAVEIAESRKAPRSNENEDSMRGISRVEKGGPRWYVRVYKPRNGEKQTALSKAFYDSTFGGREEALAEAVKWRDRTFAEMELIKEVGPGRGLGKRMLSVAERKTIVDALLAKYGKVFVFTGTGPLAAERARLMGQTGPTLQKIRHGMANGFHLGQRRLRAEVSGFINEITPDVEASIRSAVNQRKRRWMSDEDVEDAVSSCMLSYASIDLSEVEDEYISMLAGCVVKTATCRYHARTKGRLSLDRNGNIEGTDSRQSNE